MTLPENSSPSLEKLAERIEEVKQQDGRKQRAPSPARGLSKAYNMAVEFMAAAGVASFGGYWLDEWLGTSPLLFVIGFFLGFATGVYNLLRNAKKDLEQIEDNIT